MKYQIPDVLSFSYLHRYPRCHKNLQINDVIKSDDTWALCMLGNFSNSDSVSPENGLVFILETAAATSRSLKLYQPLVLTSVSSLY